MPHKCIKAGFGLYNQRGEIMFDFSWMMLEGSVWNCDRQRYICLVLPFGIHYHISLEAGTAKIDVR
jgi:hypothetical protein